MSFEISNLFSVAGKTAIVTGGSRGIGRMIAQGYVENGVKTYISARKAEACIATAEELSEKGECIAFPADLSTKEGRDAFNLIIDCYCITSFKVWMFFFGD